MQFAKTTWGFANDYYANFKKHCIEFCVKRRKWFGAARTKWFCTQHVPFCLHFGWHLKIDSSFKRYPFCFRFCVKVSKSFPSCQTKVRISCSVQKWFKVHKVRILPSLLSQSSQIICLPSNQFESQTRDSSFRRYASYFHQF